MEQAALIAATASLLVVAPAAFFALWEIRRTAKESREAMRLLKDDLLPLIREMRQSTEEAGDIIHEIRQAFRKTSTLWGVLGEVGESVDRARSFIREQGASLSRLLGVFTKTEGPALRTMRKRCGNGEHV